MADRAGEGGACAFDGGRETRPPGRRGCDTTGCAFLARRQRALAQAVAVPLAARSLGLPPAQGATLGGEGRTAWG
ncbi:MAG: hypothetical protein NZ533_05620 [Casimicrobiaceae bacterium]|nr:hypothetical protein [Casimicrobiaceae bacterium]